MILAPVVKTIRAYDSTEWEIFISEWQKGLQGYKQVKRLGGPGDHGRDVIGLCDSQNCNGVWDNFQCKHYEVPLPTSKACVDAGKIIFHAFEEVFKPPRRCIFVAPRGPSTELRDLLLNPEKLKAEIIAKWDVRVAKNIVSGQHYSLKGDLQTFVEAYDFTTFGYATIDEVLDDHRKTAYWAARFDGLLPPAPIGVTPEEIAPQESNYVGKLLGVYSQHTGKQYTSTDELKVDQELSADLLKQRVRFFDAEAFIAHFRDQTTPGTVEDFAEQIHDAIEPYLTVTTLAFEKLAATLTIASQTKVASVLEPRARVRVKQGVCHQLANADRIDWI